MKSIHIWALGVFLTAIGAGLVRGHFGDAAYLVLVLAGLLGTRYAAKRFGR